MSATAVATSKKLGSMPSLEVENFGQQQRESVIVDELASNADALVEPDEMGTGEGVHSVAGGFERGAEKRDRRSFAIGPRDVEDGWKLVLRAVEAVEQSRDALEAEAVAGG